LFKNFCLKVTSHRAVRKKKKRTLRINTFVSLTNPKSAR